MVLLVLAALTASFVAGRATAPDEEVVGMAEDSSVALVDDMIEVWNTKDLGALDTVYTEDAVFEDLVSDIERNGLDEIGTMIDEPGDWQIVRTSDVVQQGDLVTFTITYLTHDGVATLQLAEGLIDHQWVMG